MTPGAQSTTDLTLPPGRMRVPPVLRAGAAQLGAWLVVTSILPASALHGGLVLLLQGCLAAGFGRALRLAPWWAIVNLVFPLAVSFALTISVPPTVYLVTFLLLAGIYGSTFRTQVPLYLSNARALDALETLLPSDRPFRLLDIGCGTGTVLLRLARTFPSARFHGVELALLPFGIARMRAGFRSERIQVERTDYWKENLGDYDVVYAFLSPVPMADLWRKVSSEMRAGALFVSNTFEVPGVKPDFTIHVGPGTRSLFVWRIGGRA